MYALGMQPRRFFDIFNALSSPSHDYGPSSMYVAVVPTAAAILVNSPYNNEQQSDEGRFADIELGQTLVGVALRYSGCLNFVTRIGRGSDRRVNKRRA